MKKIKLKKLMIKNFKGIKELNIDFGKLTSISGENALGKTSVMDAFMWLLFNKDSFDRMNFDIKPNNPDGSVRHGLESSVTGEIEVDGKLIILEKIFKEKWQRKRGEAEKEFDGNTKVCIINNIPVREIDYKEKIKEICEEKLFKLVTNPNYFPSLKWEEQRAIIQAIIGDIDDDKVINYNSKLKTLRIEELDSIENLALRTKATIKKLKEQRKQIPFRIDELENSKEKIDIEELENEHKKIKSEIKKIDEMLQDNSKGNEILLEHKQKLFDLKNELQEKINHTKLLLNKPLDHFKKDLSNKRYEVQNLAFGIKEIEIKIKTKEKDIESGLAEINKNEIKLKSLRNDFLTVKESQFELDVNSTICPTCNRELENSEEIIKELEEKFNLSRADKLKKINVNGKTISNENNEIIEKIDEVKAALFDLEKALEEKKNEKIEADKEIETLEEKINNFVPKEINFEGKIQLENEIAMTQADIDNFKLNDNSEIKEKKKSLVDDLEKINKKIALYENIKKTDERIKELSEEEKDISKNITKLEGTEFLCEEFMRTKIELSEGLINKKFKNIKFKLFKQLAKGELKETCEILVNGVSYNTNVNTGAKVLAGLEVTETLSEFYEVQAPIFIDNKESITSKIETKAQLIMLKAVEGQKELKVEVTN